MDNLKNTFKKNSQVKSVIPKLQSKIGHPIILEIAFFSFS